MDMQDTGVLSFALTYASMGFYVLPTHLPSKNAGTYLGKKWQDKASRDPKVITSWFETKYPDAAVGLLCGTKSGLVVLDIDPRNGGVESFTQFLIDEGITHLPETLMVKTGSGGIHYYYKCPDYTVENQAKLHGKYNGIEVRGNNVCTVAPPSFNPETGNTYTFLNDLPLAMLPDYIGKRQKQAIKPVTFENGSRNVSLTKFAGTLRALGMTVDQIHLNLVWANTHLCEEPVEDKELLGIAESVGRYEPTNTKHPDWGVTDDKHGEMFETYFNNKLKHNHSSGKWYMFNGQIYVPCQKSEELNFGAEFSDFYYEQARNLADADESRTFMKDARSLGNLSRKKAMLTVGAARPHIATKEDEWNNEPYLFAVANGILDLRSGMLQKGDPKYLINMTSQVAYDRTAGAPRFMQFLDEIFMGDNDTIHTMQMALGYAMTGVTKESSIFFLYGKGANGKSVLLNTISKVFGDYYHVTPFSTFEKYPGVRSSNDLADLVGKRLVSASEASDRAGFDESRIKSVTGGESITARHLYHEDFSFKPVCKLFLSSNHQPRVSDDSPAFWRRMNVIPFPASFLTNPDVSLQEKLYDELPGILNWCLEGTIMFHENGEKVEKSKAITDATTEYQEVSNPLADFYNKFIEFGEGMETTFTSFQTAYDVWASSRNLKGYERWSIDRLHKKLNSDYKKEKRDNETYYKGLQVKRQEQSSVVVKTVKKDT